MPCQYPVLHTLLAFLRETVKYPTSDLILIKNYKQCTCNALINIKATAI